eukprot:GHUV01020752.1.p1 GENE.GHUV01020752.1~~GHUV01020752.1.p1  ORF type:complete len:800 (+),score=338.07 GHUV01020752.1:19-2418(+)
MVAAPERLRCSCRELLEWYHSLGKQPNPACQISFGQQPPSEFGAWRLSTRNGVSPFLLLLFAEAEYKQQPSRLQQQIAELNHQLEVVQHRAAAKEASSRKYKEAVRAFKTKLQERDDALAQRQSQVLELHTELSQLQRLFKMGPAGAVRSSTHLMSAPGSPGAAWGARDSGGVYSPTRAGVRLGSAGSRSAPEEVLAAATDEVERLRVEVHGFHLEMGALQAQVAEKDALLQRALADTAALDHDRGSIAARAEEATQAAFNLEKQLREARQSLEETEKRRATVAEKLAAAEARCEGLQSDQARWIRAEGALRAQVEELQEQLSTQEQQQSKLLQQAKEVAQKESDANRRIQQLESRAETLEAKLDASSSEAGQLMRRADRHENATSTLQAQLEAASRQAKEFAQALLNTESRLRDSNRQNIDLQHSCEELARKCDAADRARQQLQEQLTAAESRIATADRRAADLDSQLLLLGRALREAEGAALEWQGKARQAEQARQDIGNMVAGSEKAVQQLQSDLAQLQLSHSSERSQAQQQQDQLRSALSEAQAAKTAAELRLMEAEKQLADVRASLSSQERLLGVLRQQAAEDGSAVQQVAELHNTVQMLENALAEQRRTVQQLRTAAAASQAEQQATVQGLLAELSDKSNQLVDAERRFSQLESLMQRIASRTGQGAALGQGLTTGSSGSLTGDIMGSFTGGGAAAAAQPQQQQQRGVGAGGLGLGLTAKLQQWEQQRLSNGLRASRDFQQQTSDRWDMNGVRSAGGGGIGAGLAGPCGRCGVRGCDGGVLCAGFRGSPTRAV